MKTSLIVSNQQAIKILLNGGVGVMPTDTVYGLVSRAADPIAVARFYATKKRERKPGTIIAANVKQLVNLGIKKRYLSAVEQWWPNPLSVVIPTGNDLQYLHLGLDSLAVRIPNNPAFIAILEQTGPLLTTSANHPGEPNANSVAESYDYFNDIVDFYVDGGDLSGHPPSTIIRVIDDAIEVLREGAVKITETGVLAPVATSSQANDTCPFCLDNKLLDGSIVAETDDAYLITARDSNDRYLIVPRQHVELPTDLSDDWWKDVKQLLINVPDLEIDYNISVNYGKVAGQTVKHLHFWVIPRLLNQPASNKGLGSLIDKVNNDQI